MFNDQPSTTERPEAESARPRLRTRALALPLLVVAGIASVTACSKKEMAPEAVSRPADGSALGGPLAQAKLAESYAGEPAVAQAPAPPSGAPRMEAEKKSMGIERDEERADDFGLSQKPTQFDTEAYDHIVENRFVSASHAPLSTFSIDVDTASYSNVRRFLASETKPPAGAVRIEELINYFEYDYAEPRGDEPFSVYTEVGPAPWAPGHRLLHIGLQGKRIKAENIPPRNLVFLIDTSGSMEDENKLPLLRRSFAALLDTMRENDTVSMVAYAGSSGLVLPPTAGSRKAEILSALDRLSAGGSTNGGEGIQLAYQTALSSFKNGGVNRVILATDGDFNVGVTNQSDLVSMIEQKRDSGVFLTVLGYGMGNYKDSTLEKLADSGNGNYAYIDSFDEARKVLLEQGAANLVTIAQDVKIQVEMNPELVGAYRLIGYENRVLQNEDFNDDRKDAGDIGAGHTVTALYELLDTAQAAREANVDALRYQRVVPREGGSSELATVKLRYKAPLGRTSRLIEFPVRGSASSLEQTSEAFRFSAAVAGFGMLLRGSTHRGAASFPMVSSLASGALGPDRNGYRREFLGLVERAERL
jgi:Ca-activated chloride channel family protein